MNPGMKIFFTSIVLLLIAAACMDDFDKDNDTIYYQPTYSIPIGPLDYTLGDIMPYLALTPIDTSIIIDTVPLLFYDDSLFFINPPTGHDTSFVELYDISSFSKESRYTRSLMIRANYSNSLPMKMEYQVYFLDANDGLLDSLFEFGHLEVPSASRDENNIVTAPYTGREERYFDTTDIATLLNTRKLEIAIHLETFKEAPNILPIYSDYTVSFELALRAGLIIPFE